MMNYLTDVLSRSGLLKEDLDYHLIRASMVIVFLLFGYQKWFEYEAQVLIPYISNGPLISWMYPVFGIRGATWFLGVSEWLFGTLLFWGFWNKKAGVLGALGGAALEINWRIRNGSMTEFVFSGERITLDSFNQVGHFNEPELETYR